MAKVGLDLSFIYSYIFSDIYTNQRTFFVDGKKKRKC